MSISDQIIPQPIFRRRNIQILLFVLLLAFLFWLAFRTQIRDVVIILVADISIWFGWKKPEITPEMLASQEILLINLGIFLLILFLTIVIVAPALLPIITFREIYGTLNFASILTTERKSPVAVLQIFLQIIREIWRTIFHFILNTLGLLGPAIFIQDGSTSASEEELRRKGIGVAVVDYNSAIVLEEEVPPFTFKSLFYIISEAVLWGLGLYNRHLSPRIQGAGIVFIRRLERIRSIVDLRRQTRSNLSTRAYTRDGIEVTSIVWVLFTLGQEPDIQQVTYSGEQRPENLRIVSLKMLENGNIRISEIKDSLQNEDKQDIHKTIQEHLNSPGFFQPYADIPEQPIEPVFNAERVFNAAFNQARDINGDLIPWQKLPLNLTIEAFRRVLIRYNFDQIFNPSPDQNPDAPISTIRETLNQTMVNSGLLSFRLISYRQTGGQLILNNEYPSNLIRVSRPIPQQRVTPLRQRGIKIIAAGFTDLMVSDTIYDRRLEYWQAGLTSQIAITQANSDLASMRIRTKARLEKQEAILSNLTQIFELNKNSDEAVVLNVIHWINTMVADPYTRQMLPLDTITLLQEIVRILSPCGLQGYY